MIAAAEYRETSRTNGLEELKGPNHELSDQLRIELNRLYEMEGGRNIIEKCQESALRRLDSFEKTNCGR